MDIVIGSEIKKIASGLKVIAIEADVSNAHTPDTLWQEISMETRRIADTYTLPEINKRPGIAATRMAYKTLGKDPNRYRPSSEALCRRAVKGMELYRINALVDIINLISLRSGYSIGGFDSDRIAGNSLVLGVGHEGEDFNAIGRGALNIHNLPVYRDDTGGIGTPTSDEERTKLTCDTRHLLICINIYGEELSPDETISYTRTLLEKYCNARNITVTTYH